MRPAVAWNVVTVSLRQAVVPDVLLGRVNSAYRLVGWGTMPIGALLGGLLADVFGLRAPFFVGGVVTLVLGVAMIPLINNRTVAAAHAAVSPRPGLTPTPVLASCTCAYRTYTTPKSGGVGQVEEEVGVAAEVPSSSWESWKPNAVYNAIASCQVAVVSNTTRRAPTRSAVATSSVSTCRPIPRRRWTDATDMRVISCSPSPRGMTVPVPTTSSPSRATSTTPSAKRRRDVVELTVQQGIESTPPLLEPGEDQPRGLHPGPRAGSARCAEPRCSPPDSGVR